MVSLLGGLDYKTEYGGEGEGMAVSGVRKVG
jgi:hypothetical protein